MVNREREESAVGVRTYAGCSSALGEQADLCTGETRETTEQPGEITLTNEDQQAVIPETTGRITTGMDFLK